MKKTLTAIAVASLLLTNTTAIIYAQTPRSEVISSFETKRQSWKPGMYKIGTDLEAGEYYLKGAGYYEVSADSSGTLDSIVCNDNIDHAAIVTVTDGQYFKVTGKIKIYKYGDNPKINTKKSGMFKVGTDLPAGEYKLVIDKTSKHLEGTGLGGYYEVSSDSTHNLETIIANDNFEDSTYLTVSDGQYLKLSNCHIEQ